MKNQQEGFRIDRFSWGAGDIEEVKDAKVPYTKEELDAMLEGIKNATKREED